MTDLSWQVEKILDEIRKATGTPDDYVHIPYGLLVQVAKLGVLDGQLDATHDAVKRLKEAKVREQDLLGLAVDLSTPPNE